jgi:hypothetical protein
MQTAGALSDVRGAANDTAAIARKHDVYVCDLPRNRGQGAALRLGYLYSGRNANTEATINTALVGATTVVARWSTPVSGSCAPSTTMPDPPEPA